MSTHYGYYPHLPEKTDSGRFSKEDTQDSLGHLNLLLGSPPQAVDGEAEEASSGGRQCWWSRERHSPYWDD